MDHPALPRLDPNTADVEALTQLPGVGRTLAQRIVEVRPFQNLDDLRRVPGLREAGLARLGPYLHFAPASAQVDGQPIPRPGMPPADGEAPFTRRQTLWLTAGSALIAVALSIVMTLVVLAGINGTLDIGRARSVRQLRTDLSAAQTSLDDVNLTLESVGSRLEALQGLTGRMTTVEGQVADVRGDIEQALRQVQGLEGALEEVQASTEALGARADRFDAFLDGLHALLGGTSPASEEAP
jgi:ribosomal protein S13